MNQKGFFFSLVFKTFSISSLLKQLAIGELQPLSTHLTFTSTKTIY